MNDIRYPVNPLLTAQTPVWRSKLLVLGLALVFIAMIARAAYVQVFDNAFFKNQGEARFVRTVTLAANRGRILDRNGRLLASSVVAPDVWASPADVNASQEELAELARLLQLPLSTLQERLANKDKTFVWLKRRVDGPVAQQIAELKLAGVHQDRGYKRRYPEGEAVAQLIGFTDIENQGLDGIELALDERLAGRPGQRRVIRDRLGRVVEQVGEEIPPTDGQDVQLAIDIKVQTYAYQKLRDAVERHGASAGSVVVLDAQTSEVLALTNYPSYVPGDRGNLNGPQLRNAAVTDAFEPGSVMKPITAAIALDSGDVQPLTAIDTAPGRYRMGRFVIQDTHNYGTLTVQGVIQKSSNIGALKIAQKLTPQHMWETYTALGFGRRPDILFPGATTGQLRFWKEWRPVEQATMSYGYGLSASLLQVAHAYTAFANDGVLMPLSLLRRPDHAQVPGVRVFSVNTARAVRQMLHMAVEPGGTGTQARTVGYSVGGKTGTARKQVSGGYAARKYRAWFVGMAPVNAPQVIVAVMIDEPTDGRIYGGAVAAPVFRDIAQQALRIRGVKPDLVVEPAIVASRSPQEPS